MRPKTLSSNEVRPKGPLESRNPSRRGASAQWRAHVMSAQQPSSAKKVMKTSLRSGGCIGRPFPLSEGPILRLVAFPSFSSKANARHFFGAGFSCHSPGPFISLRRPAKTAALLDENVRRERRHASLDFVSPVEYVTRVSVS